MALKLFYITNRPDVALIAEKYGVDRIWIDLETLGKSERQHGLNSVKSRHRISDIKEIKPVLSKAELLVRVNPWNERSEEEIDDVIESGADIVMLPMWKTPEEVDCFLSAVGGRAKTTLLLETKEAAECVSQVLERDFDEIHIGLNDLHLSYGMKFMFELLADGTVERLCGKFRAAGIPYGFGGIARLGKGMLPAKKIIMEHYRLGSTRAILSRSFCDVDNCSDIGEVEETFRSNLPPLRVFEKKCELATEADFLNNKADVVESVRRIVGEIIRNER